MKLKMSTMALLLLGACATNVIASGNDQNENGTDRKRRLFAEAMAYVPDSNARAEEVDPETSQRRELAEYYKSGSALFKTPGFITALVAQQSDVEDTTRAAPTRTRDIAPCRRETKQEDLDPITTAATVAAIGTRASEILLTLEQKRASTKLRADQVDTAELDTQTTVLKQLKDLRNANASLSNHPVMKALDTKIKEIGATVWELNKTAAGPKAATLIQARFKGYLTRQALVEAYTSKLDSLHRDAVLKR